MGAIGGWCFKPRRGTTRAFISQSYFHSGGRVRGGCVRAGVLSSCSPACIARAGKALMQRPASAQTSKEDLCLQRREIRPLTQGVTANVKTSTSHCGDARACGGRLVSACAQARGSRAIHSDICLSFVPQGLSRTGITVKQHLVIMRTGRLPAASPRGYPPRQVKCRSTSTRRGRVGTRTCDGRMPRAVRMRGRGCVAGAYLLVVGGVRPTGGPLVW